MIRGPRDVAKSQERLKRDGKFITECGEEIDIYKNQKIHTPEMFINVTAMAARWLRKNKDIPVLYVHFDDLIAKPVKTLKRITGFLGEGDFEKAAATIDPKLKRSEAEDVPNFLWGDADKIYELFCKKRFLAIDKYMKKDAAIRDYKKGWFCLRLRMMTVEAHCVACQNSRKFMWSLKKHANKNKIDWKNEPCAYECAYRPKGRIKSISASIKNNHWIEKKKKSERKELIGVES